MNHKNNILVLDDSEERMIAFRQRLSGCCEPDYTIHYAYNADDAISTLDRVGLNNFTLIFLDHDLNEEHNMTIDLGAGTGSEVAQWIADRYVPTENPSLAIILHSANSWGATNMFNILELHKAYAIIRPFVWLREVWEKTFA